MQNVIEVLKKRGFIEATTSEELALITEKPVRVYCGFDPTSDSLHLGNLVAMMGLAWFQRFGHTPVVVVGGATGLIGDPSGKSRERPLLTSGEIESNVLGITKNLNRLLAQNPSLPQPLVLNNFDWFQSISLINFLRDIGKHSRMGTMLARDNVRSRLESEEGMSFTEFCYSLLQAFDFLYLYQNHDVTVQLGGSDQWGNITAGTELIRKMTGSSAYGVTFPLLTQSDGKKFGKTEKGAVWLSRERLSPYEFYQYLVRIQDRDVIKLMKLLTFMEIEEIEEIERSMKEKSCSPNSAQKRLAKEVTLLIHGQEGLQEALTATEGAKPGSDTVLTLETLEAISPLLPTFFLSKQEVLGEKLVDLAAALQIKSSKGEARRLIRSGGCYLNNEKVTEENFIFTREDFIEGQFAILAFGKKHKYLLRLSEPLI